MRLPLILGTNLVLGAALLAWAFHGWGRPALEILGADPSLALVACFVAAFVAILLIFAWRWRFILAGLGRPLTFPALTLYRSAAHSLAVLLPIGRLGGDPLRAWLAARAGVPPGDAIASVAVDRSLEIGAAAPFSVVFATLLVQEGIPQLERALGTIMIGTLGLVIGAAIAVRRLRRGAGLVSSLARKTRLDNLRVVYAQSEVINDSDNAAARLVSQPRRMLIAFAAGFAANLLVIAEFALLLSAFGLPSSPIAVVAAIFATGAAHMLPVPAGIGALEGGQIWLFGMLGYPAEVGLAVGLAVRFRELIWMLPGLLYLLGRSIRSSLARLRWE